MQEVAPLNHVDAFDFERMIYDEINTKKQSRSKIEQMKGNSYVATII